MRETEFSEEEVENIEDDEDTDEGVDYSKSFKIYFKNVWMEFFKLRSNSSINVDTKLGSLAAEILSFNNELAQVTLYFCINYISEISQVIKIVDKRKSVRLRWRTSISHECR